MAINGCSSRIALALLVFTFLPVQHYLPLLSYSRDDSLVVESVSPLSGVPTSFDITSENVPPLDVFIATALLVLGVLIYICEWIQRKITERRIVKLKHFLSVSLCRLNAWDVRQEQLESRLRMIQNATTEYNLLLYLLLHKDRGIDCIPSTYLFERELNYEHSY